MIRVNEARLQLGDVAAVTPLVVRTSQSGIIPDTPGPLPEISGLIPDTEITDPTFKVGTIRECQHYVIFIVYTPQAWLTGSHHRTTKSGILVKNPITRVEDDLSSPEPTGDQEEETAA